MFSTQTNVFVKKFMKFDKSLIIKVMFNKNLIKKHIVRNNKNFFISLHTKHSNYL